MGETVPVTHIATHLANLAAFKRFYGDDFQKNLVFRKIAENIKDCSELAIFEAVEYFINLYDDNDKATRFFPDYANFVQTVKRRDVEFKMYVKELKKWDNGIRQLPKPQPKERDIVTPEKVVEIMDKYKSDTPRVSQERVRFEKYDAQLDGVKNSLGYDLKKLQEQLKALPLPKRPTVGD